MGVETLLQAYGQPLETVSYLKYMGRPLTASCDDWTSSIANFLKDIKIWY